MEKLMRDARLLRTYEAAEELRRLVITKEILVKGHVI
jgi:alkylation response protein AidB-like acyl-CoA dehydrogenase